MGYCPWLVSCILIRLNPRMCWDREKKRLMQRLGRRICPGTVFDCGHGTKVTFKFTPWQFQVAWWLRWQALTAEALIRFHDGAKSFLLYGLLWL